MPWFRNHYTCARCARSWKDAWSAMCDDDCPHCGARHMSPANGDDLSRIIDRDGDDYVVLESAEEPKHYPDYREIGWFATLPEAESFRRT